MPAPIQISGFGTNTCSGSLLNASSLLINQAICGCGGRVVREGDTANNISVSGVNWIIEPSAYFGVVYITPVVGPDQPTVIPVIIDSQITIPTVAGDGTLIIRIDDIYTDALNNTTSGYIFPTNASAFEFIPNVFTCEDIKTYLAGDGFAIIGSVVGGVLEQAPLAELCMPVNCDVMTDCITNVFNDLFIDSGSGGGFSLTPKTPYDCINRGIKWSQFFIGPSGSYRIYRNGVLINTVGYNTLDYNDAYFIAPPISYRVDAVDIYGTIVQSNTITFTTGCGNNIPCSYKGTGVDGVFTGGALQRGVVYNFSSINLTQDIELQGNGQAVIFVDGNITTNGYDVKSLPSTNPTNTFGALTVCGVPLTSFTYTNKATAVGGVGGNQIRTCPGITTFNTYCEYDGGNANTAQAGAGSNGSYNFSAGTGSPCNTPTAGGAGGTILAPNGLNGANGTSYPSPAYSVGAGGGAGGHALGHQSLLIICQDFTATASTQFIGAGGNGGNGGAGGNGTVIVAPDSQQGAGGGAGGNGGDGMAVFIKAYGTYTNPGTNILNGGFAGVGGLGGGPRGFINCIPGGIQTAPNGASGQNGVAGVNGGLTLL